MQTLVDFLNHGILPFTGRDRELGTLVQFWRDTYDAPALRSVWLSGEAGVGKSRLIEELIPSIIAAGGAVVHAKLYPESTASITSLLAQGLRGEGSGRGLLGEGTKQTMGEVASALRRLARLRSTLVIIEDVHLLSGGALTELAQLLGAIGEETISLLCAARPVECGARAVVEPSLVREIVLEGLTVTECGALWERMVGSGAREIHEALHDATAGNLLALRSALRNTLQGGMLEPSGDVWYLTITPQIFSHSLRRSVSLLAGGMTAHLTQEELHAARRLALLGEIFAREAAAALLDDAPTMLGALIFKGVLAGVATTSRSLSGAASAYPLLAFTHTLLHRALVDQALAETAPEKGAIDPNALLAVIGAGRPLCSILPVRLIAERRDALRAGAEHARDAIGAMTMLARELNRTPDWEMAGALLDAAEAVAERCGEGASWREDARYEIVNAHLNVGDRETYETLRPWMEFALERIAAADTEENAARLVGILGLKLWKHPVEAREIIAQVDRAIARYPSLKPTAWYISFLRNYSASLTTQRDPELAAELAADFNRRLDEALAMEGLNDELRHDLTMALISHMGSRRLASEEELEGLIAELRELGRPWPQTRAFAGVVVASLLKDAGLVEEYLAEIPWMLDYYRGIGYVEMEANVILYRAFALHLRDGLAELERELERFLEGPGKETPEFWRVAIGAMLFRMAILLGRYDDARRLADAYQRLNGIYARARLALASGGAEDLRSLDALTAERSEGSDDRTTSLMITLAHAAADDPIAVATARELLDMPLIGLEDLHAIPLVGAWIERAPKGAKSLRAALREPFAAALRRALAWLARPGRKLHNVIDAFVKMWGEYLKEDERSEWIARAEALREDRKDGDDMIALSMLGAVTAVVPGAGAQRFQGARIRMLLAMMVLAEMLEKPLAPDEFVRIAAGEEAEFDSARNIVKNSIHRLRKTLGHDAILTDAELPRLNPARVRVDLLEAHALLLKAREATGRRQPAQARRALLDAFAILRGEVVFPSLYDGFIEAAREDFESRLRALTLDVAGSLTRDGALADAEELYRHALQAMPGDEGIVELLHDLLLQSGKRVEAERVRRGSSEV